MADNIVQVLGDLPPHFALALRSTGAKLGSLGLLTVGSRGPLVESLQRVIKAYDPTPNLPRFVDGVFGPRTRDALYKYQQANGERPTGYADDAWLQKHGVVQNSSSGFKSPTNPLTPSAPPKPAVVENSIFDVNVLQPMTASGALTPLAKKLLIAGGIAGALLALYYWRKSV